MRRPATLLLAVCSAFALTGCVAAIIPLAAGGALAGKARLGGPDIVEPATAPPVPIAATEEDGADGTLPESWTLADGSTAHVTAATALPVPSTASARDRLRTYDGFYGAAITQAAPATSAVVRESALLAEPGRPVLAQCPHERPGAVLIDLDPQGSLFDPNTPPRANEALARTLSVMRARNIDVLWISGRSAEVAGAVRRKLRLAGLDPAGNDTLLLMRYPEDRKQTRRADIGQTHCLLAIAGDEREDFDEMFEYLRNPDSPTATDTLIGQRWFLTPNPLY